jgi:hypothetical protein
VVAASPAGRWLWCALATQPQLELYCHQQKWLRCCCCCWNCELICFWAGVYGQQMAAVAEGQLLWLNLGLAHQWQVELCPTGKPSSLGLQQLHQACKGWTAARTR